MARTVKKALEAVSSNPSQISRFSPAFRERKRSIILDGEEPSQNVFVNPALFKLHKRSVGKPLNKQDPQKAMSDQEFSWWSNPFLRMLSSPLRMCVLTKRYAPIDHLIRITATLLPQPDEQISTSTPAYITPSDLHHPRYAQRPGGMGSYIACSNKAIPLLSGKGRHRSTFPGAEIHGLLGEQIESGLQARCIEEAKMLGLRLRSTTRYKPGEPVAFTVRRLTVAEYELARKESILYDPKAMAVIVVPKGGEAPETSAEASLRSRMLLRSPTPQAKSSPGKPPPTPRIPVFRITSMFQNVEHRTRLRKSLDQALSAERNAVRNSRTSLSGNAQKSLLAPYEPKGRDAYVLCASRRVDAVPLAIALWRLGSWQGHTDG